MSFDDPTGHPSPSEVPGGRPAIATRRAPGRTSSDEAPTPQRSVGDILRECECVIFDPEDERMSDVLNRMVSADTRFGIRVRISAGTYKIPFNGMPPLDIGTTLADILNRWGPGKYILELVRLGASDGTTGQPLKSLTANLQARSGEDVGQEDWPIQWDDPRVTAELRRDRDDRRKIRTTPGWTPPSDDDDNNDQGGPGDFGPGYGPEYPEPGRGDPRGQVDFRDPRGGAWSQGGMSQPGYGQPGMQGMPGAPGSPSDAIATNPHAYPPGTTWVMSPHGFIPQLPAPVAPPPPALTAEALAAAITAAQPKREPSLLEQLLATAVGSLAAAMHSDPVGMLKNVREAISPPAPPPPPPPPPAVPQGPTAAEIALQMQKIALESQLALANMQRDRDLALEKIQRENEARLRDMEMKQASQRAQDQLAALQAQLAATRGQETEQAKTLKAQIVDLTKQVSAAQRGAAPDSSAMGAFLSIASSPMGQAIGSVIEKIGEKLTADPPPPQYPPQLPPGVPATPQMQAQWAPPQAAPQWAPEPQYAPPQQQWAPPSQAVPQHAPQAQWVPEPAPEPQWAPAHEPPPAPHAQWAPEPQYAPPPAPAPVQEFLPGVDPVAEQSPGMPPFDADAPVAQDAPADPQTSDEEPS